MDIFYFLLKIMALLLMFTNGGNSSKGCKMLSNECRFEEKLINSDLLVCNSLKKSFEMKVDEYNKCKNNHTFFNQIYFKPSSPEILDNSHNLSSISNFLVKIVNINNPDKSKHSIYIPLTYSNLKGFDLNTSFSIDDSYLNQTYFLNYYFEISNSNLQFFLNNKLQVSCDDYLKWNLTQPRSLLQIKSSGIGLNNVKFSKTPICPLYFINANVNSFSLSYQINTFYKKNYLSFSTFNSSDIDLFNVNIGSLSTYYSEKINIDSNSFLNKYVFQNITMLYLYGEINSIDKDILKSFKQLEIIFFESTFFGKLSRKGIEWISSINFDLNVNLTNRTELDLNVNQTKVIELREGILSNDKKVIMIFKNEDFCLFKDFHFNQLIIFRINDLKDLKYILMYTKQLIRPKYTCTIQWILQYHHLYAKYRNLAIYSLVYSDFLTSNRENISFKFEKCDFEKMIDNCNRTKFQTGNNEWTMYDTKETIIVIEFILIILLPIICFIGLLFNIIIIYTLSIKDNKKDLKTVQYSYLKMVSFSNIMVLIISMLSPLYECQSFQKSYDETIQDEGIYCSPYHKLIFVQYYKIIFAEFLCSVFKLLSNFGYIGFSICRLSMIGKEQTNLTKSFSKIPIVYYIIASTILSVGLSVVKIFKYEVNTFNPEKDYPTPLDRKYILDQLENDIFYLDLKKKVRLIQVIYGVSDLISLFLFIPINFILDIVLIVKIKKALSEKINFDVKKEKEILFRVKILAVTFLLSNFLMKLPLMFKSIFDMAYIIKTVVSHSRFSHTENWHYPFHLFSIIFDKFANILFIISLSSIIFFYYLFDKNFKFGLKIAISKLTSSEKSHLEYVEALEKSRNKK